MQESLGNRDVFKGIHGDLMEFADRISSILGCPITLEDESHHLLAYSIHDDTTDQARISTIIGRRVPEKVINSLWKDGIIPALLKGDRPIKVAAIKGVGLRNRAAVSIRKNNEILGFIWALEVNKPFSEEDLDFLQLAAKEAKNQLPQLQLKKNKKESGHQEFLWRLITGHYQELTELTDTIEKFSIQTPAIFSILVFEFPKEITQEVERFISYMLTTTQIIKGSLFTIDQNKLIVLAGSHGDNQMTLTTAIYDFVTYFILEMKGRFGVQNILGTSGNIYLNLADGMLSYQEALTTLKMKNIFPEETDWIIHYQDLGILQSLDLLSAHKKQQENPSLRKLSEYDTKNQTDLLHTLTVFLEKDGNINEASKQLHIHVNTLNYRLKRITDVGHVRLKDPIQKMSLLLDIKLIQYRKLL